MTKPEWLKLIEYWQDGSRRDWDAYLALRRARKYGHALFFLHLALEKKLKAAIVKESKAHAPFSHNLVYLAAKLACDVSEALLEDLKAIGEFNMESRYPNEKSDFFKRATKKYADHWHGRGQDITAWLDRHMKR